jgi:isomerase DpgB
VTLQLRIDGAEPLSYDLVAKVNAFSDRVEDAGATATIHLTGAPASPAHPDSIHLVNKWERALRRLERLGAVKIAIATGDCGGIATEVLLCTDYRLASRDLRVLVPAGLDAAWPGMGLYRLANQVGVARVRRAVLFGTPIQATEAVTLGLVDELGDDVTELVASCPGPELAVRRQLMLDATTTSFEDALGRHLAACDRELRRTGTEVAVA